MIEVFEGSLGGGKTYHAVKRILERMADGSQVRTNILLKRDNCESYVRKHYGVNLDWGHQYHYLEPNQISRFIDNIETDCLVVIDECHVWFNARDWSKADREVLEFLTFSRKFRVDIIFISQSLFNIDKQFARLMLYVWRFRDMETFKVPGIGWKWPFKQFVAAQFDKDGKTCLERYWRTKDPEIYGCYDTLAILSDVKVRAGSGKKKLTKVSKKPGKMKMVLPAFILIMVLGAVFFGVRAANGQKKDGPAKTAVKGSDGEKKKSEESEPAFAGAAPVNTKREPQVYADKFRVIALEDGYVVTDHYTFRKGESSMVGEVMDVSANGVSVRCWDGHKRIIIRDLTPDAPFVYNGGNGDVANKQAGARARLGSSINDSSR